jgi:hypothetical protein
LLRAALATELLGRDAAGIEAISGNELELLSLIKRCTEHRELWLKRGVGVMLRRWMVDERVSERLLARADGERRMTNLLHLCECLHEAWQGASGHASPEALLRWLHNQRSQGRRDDATQLRLESDRNLVQIVTVHKAKGLEYPIVFCPALWDGRPAGFPSGLDGKEYHDDHDQPVVDFRPDFDKSVDTGGAIKQVIARAAFDGGLIHEVLLTRAEFEEVHALAREEGNPLATFEREGLAPFADAITSLAVVEAAIQMAAEEAPEDYDDGLPDEEGEGPAETVVNPTRDVGRNDPCPCGSGKKFKKCCLAA